MGSLSLLIVDLLDVLLPLIIMLAIDVISGHNKDYSLLFCALSYLCLILTQGVLRLLYRYNLSISNVRSGDDLRSMYCKSLLEAPVNVLERERTGDLVARMSSDVDTVSGVFDQGMITLFDAIFYLVSVPLIMLVLSWKLALIALIPLPLIPFLVVKNDRRIRERYRESQQHLSSLSSLAQESVIGSRIIKSFSAESSIAARYQKLGLSYSESMLLLARTESIFGPSLEIVVAVSMLLVLFVGGSWAISGAVTLGTFIALQRYTQQLLWPMQAVGIAIGIYQRAVASSDRTESILSTKAESSGQRAPSMPCGKSPLIELENVTFTYPGAGESVLSSVSLSIYAGETVALVGGNGSGKSTLLALIPKLYSVDSGSVRVFGEDVEHWDLKKLRSQIGFVAQDVLVLSGTLRENVALSAGASVTASEIEHASKVAALDGEISRFPNGFETMLGERGINLSGGQRQRLSIARAVVKSSPLLILDDVFSSVDSQTEAAIRNALLKSNRSQAQIVVSHRLSTVRDANRILVLERGRIIQSGTHAELIATDGWYRKFYQEQRLIEDLEQYSRELHERHS